MDSKSFSASAIMEAGQMAMERSTQFGRKRGGWIRLARVASMTDRKEISPYVVAFRPTEKGYQLGCDCPDWIHRHSHSGGQCKHQKLFLEHLGTTNYNKGIWMYRAGIIFLDTVWNSLAR